MKHTIAFLCLIAFTLSGCSDMDDKIHKLVADYPNVIKPADPLYGDITKILNHSDDPLTEIACVDFVYPMTLLTYDENLNVVSANEIIGDANFSDYLGSLPVDYAISISYPIQTQLQDGTLFTITNNLELKTAIDNCHSEDIILYYSGLFCPPSRCIWNVKYTEGGSNDYASGIFSTNADGTLTFSYNGESYLGTWSFLFINDELHINIHLNGTSAVAQYWNFDAAVAANGNFMTITREGGSIVLNQSCEATELYEIGDPGPQNGIVFYDKGAYSDGWRYIEIAANDTAVSQWGCAVSIPEAQSDAIGKGFYNSVKIANFHDNFVGFYNNPTLCSSSSDGTVAAKRALLYQSDVQQAWYLPTKEELALAYTNLNLLNPAVMSGMYWSSTEADLEHAFVLDFQSGAMLPFLKNPTDGSVKTRPVHYF